MTRTRQRAILLLESCANQETWLYAIATAPGFLDAERKLADAAVDECPELFDSGSWRIGYAEAAALLREGAV
jgi:hypothetical protein